MTCDRCGAPDAPHSLAAQMVCTPCWSSIREPILARVILDTPSVLLRDGIDRPEHGPGMVDCRCTLCDATLVAVPGQDCPYCDATWERMARWQADKLLRPTLPDPDDRRHGPAALAWLDRLAVGVQAGLITEHQARAAWGRHVADVAA